MWVRGEGDSVTPPCQEDVPRDAVLMFQIRLLDINGEARKAAYARDRARAERARSRAAAKRERSGEF